MKNERKDNTGVKIAKWAISAALAAVLAVFVFIVIKY